MSNPTIPSYGVNEKFVRAVNEVLAQQQTELDEIKTGGLVMNGDLNMNGHRVTEIASLGKRDAISAAGMQPSVESEATEEAILWGYFFS